MSELGFNPDQQYRKRKTLKSEIQELAAGFEKDGSVENLTVSMRDLFRDEMTRARRLEENAGKNPPDKEIQSSMAWREVNDAISSASVGDPNTSRTLREILEATRKEVVDKLAK